MEKTFDRQPLTLILAVGLEYSANINWRKCALFVFVSVSAMVVMGGLLEAEGMKEGGNPK